MAKTGTDHTGLYANDRLRVSSICQNTQLKVRDKKVAVFNYILHQEIVSGTLFLMTEPDKSPYIRLGLLKDIIYMPKQGRGADMLFAYLYQRYGLSERDEMTKFIFDCLRSHALSQGESVEMRRFACFDKTTRTLYMSCYNGEALKIEGQPDPEYINNGENVYFADDDGGKPWGTPDIHPHGILLNTLTNLSFAEDTLGGITAEQQKRALTVWLFCLAFPDLLPTKPLLILEGAPGAGKTSTALFLQLALLGIKKPLILSKNKEDDFGVILLRSPIAVFDNLDSYIEWVPDAICAYATSGMWTRRRLYSDNEEVTIKPHSFIAIASKNPASFRREDTADRCIILRLKRREEEGFIRQERLEENILAQRDKILGEYIYYLNEIVAEIRNGAMDEDRAEAHRMADFSAMARVVSKVLHWEDSAVDDLMDALKKERNAFINEDDSLSELLRLWLNQKSGRGIHNTGRAISAPDLFGELEMLADVHRRQFYKSARTLVQKMRSPHLEAEFIIVTSNHPTMKNTHQYEVWFKPTDYYNTGGIPSGDTPNLVIIDGDSQPSNKKDDQALDKTDETDSKTENSAESDKSTK